MRAQSAVLCRSSRPPDGGMPTPERRRRQSVGGSTSGGQLVKRMQLRVKGRVMIPARRSVRQGRDPSAHDRDALVVDPFGSERWHLLHRPPDAHARDETARLRLSRCDT
jgi:hypothetical protein